MPDKPKPTLWGEMLRVAREARGLSRPVAARLANERAHAQVISPDNWGNVERGYQSLRGESRAVTGTPSTVAHMAHTVGLSADRLREAGNPAAAEVLEEMLRQDEARATHTAGTTTYDDPTDQYLADTPGLDDDAVRGLIVLARHFRQQSEPGAGSGSSR